MNLTEGQLLFRLQDFHGAEQEALGIGDYEFAQESADIACALREILQARRKIEELTAVVGQRNGECVRLHSLLEAAEKRIAELEARAISIPEVRITVAESKRKNLTWRELGAYNEGADVAKEAILAVIRSAGIGVKGE